MESSSRTLGDPSPPHLIAPSAKSTSRFRWPRYYYQGYHALPVYAIADGHPIREHSLPCCGIGLGWLLFITGFFLGGVPWYCGAFILLCLKNDYREKPGLIACTIASLIAMVAVTLGTRHRYLGW